ncbi:RNA-directed DNA methylation 4 isoform X2 [Hibiscus syriacus]|uniref:RNA-directed DNA methylation 4 isoform X2 n=1 Tax=Hibiscus syriacus TaxID=106335 RepID=UPI001922E94A|nr:RNA-directed DNA methylation 4 isoform X2 [Hibiscus syriacus]
MASNGESSSATPQSTADKPVIVRVKRKISQSRLDAFWLEINERPLKRPFSDFQNLSISESPQKEELKSKKVFVQHVDTVESSRDTVDIVQSFIPNSGKKRSQEGGRPQKTDYRQQQLSKSIQKQEVIAKNARFEQIWRSRRGKKEAVDEMCHFYDVVRVDVEEKYNNMQFEERSLEDQKLLSSYLPLLKKYIPEAVAGIESDMREYVFGKEQYVYDYYTVKDDHDLDEDAASNPFPLVQVDDEDFYDVPYESEYDSEDSNAEDNPRNDYPDELSDEEEEDEDEDEDEESKSSSSIKSSEVGSLGGYDEDLYEVDSCDDDYLGHGNSDDDTDGADWRWSYR